MAKRDKVNNEDQLLLPNVELLPVSIENRIEFSGFRKPIWTENKAKLIERYLYYFVLVTKHGIYIDGFAAPQEESHYEMWAAKLVLDNEPCWLNRFFLYDIDGSRYHHLQKLSSYPRLRDSKGNKIKRKIEIGLGDFNDIVHRLLASRKIKQNKATFCLLDQRTFECKWSTVDALARYKKDGNNKIELFYFLPNSWMDRAIAGLTVNKHILKDWWGRDDWETLRQMKPFERKEQLCDRFKQELGYKYAFAFPILERTDGGNIMYYMIHATDHDIAPKLMARAYRNAVCPKERLEQIPFTFEDKQSSEVSNIINND